MNRRKLCLVIAIIFALNIGFITIAQQVDAASYKKGSSGSAVSQIQKTLKSQGFYKGSVDGVFGSSTETAVKNYQKKYGLTADGRVGDATLKAMGLNISSSTNSGSGDLELLARLISAESRGEPYGGQVAVGACVLNRIVHPAFPNTMSGVIYQSGAFTCVTDGQFNQPIAEISRRAAREAMNGSDPSGGAIYYFNPVTATSKWIWSRPLITVIGKHRFCS